MFRKKSKARVSLLFVACVEVTKYPISCCIFNFLSVDIYCRPCTAVHWAHNQLLVPFWGYHRFREPQVHVRRLIKQFLVLRSMQSNIYFVRYRPCVRWVDIGCTRFDLRSWGTTGFSRSVDGTRRTMRTPRVSKTA